MPKGMAAKYAEIELGAEVCKLIKKTYFDGWSWSDCSGRVSEKFTNMKRIYRKLFPDKTDLEMLHDLRKYKTQDVEDIFSYEVPEDTSKTIDGDVLRGNRKDEIVQKLGQWADKPIWNTADCHADDITDDIAQFEEKGKTEKKGFSNNNGQDAQETVTTT